MKARLEGKLKYLDITREKNDKLRSIDDEELLSRKVAVKGQQINKAREYFAASKIQAIVKGFLARRLCFRKRQYIRAVNTLQRVMKGKLGRLRWQREYWRSVSVVKSDQALVELLERSKKLRHATAGGRNKYDWTEYFDPLTESFWYYNSLTKHNTWNCPLAFQTDLVCPWDGFQDYGGLPSLKEACRCPFANVQAYQNHLRTAHFWFCVACNQKNNGLSFPICHLCGNRYNNDGVDGEKVLHESMRKVRSRLETFIFRDVTDKERNLYNIRDRLMGLANERENAREAMQAFALELEVRAAEGKLTAAEKVRGQQLLMEMNDKYLDKMLTGYGADVKAQSAVVSDLTRSFFSESKHERKLAKRRKQFTTDGSLVVVTQSGSRDNLSMSTASSDFGLGGSRSGKGHSFKRSSMGNLNTSLVSKPAGTGFGSSTGGGKTKGDSNPFYDGFFQVEEGDEEDGDGDVQDNTRRHNTVNLEVQARTEQERGGYEGDRRRNRHPSTRGVFAESDFDMFMSMHEDNVASNLKLNLYDEDDSSTDEEEEEGEVDDAGGVREGGDADTETVGASRDGSRPVSRVRKKKNLKLQKLIVCERFLAGQCNLLSCPLAHPGLRDNSRAKRKSMRQPDGSKRKMPFVLVCPDCDGVYTNNCPYGNTCRNYHVYVRPSTQDIILSLYPTTVGHRSKTFSGGTTVTGNVSKNKFNGYAVMTWPDGSTYMGDFKDDLRHGRGIHRTAAGTEYVGSFVNGKRHGWGVMTNVNGDEYAGEFYEGKMQGVGRLSSIDGSVYEGNFLNGLYEGIGRYRKANGDVYLGYCKKGMAQGLGILALASGEKYKGHFERNSRHGRGACAYPNGAR